ncbi:MAG TPA: XRE family transcriptional regulator [Rhodobacteraceae bacterium]|jgi:transcriptional regulator with XRE-family HTH domain|nr:XRE family transcriptional regulator [Paracoccaceae bacterium]
MSHPVDVHVGKKLKEFRLLRGMTQTEVAEGLGISFQQVQKYELGRNRISASKLFEVSRILAIEPGEFFAGFDQITASPLPPVDDESAKIASMVARISDTRVRAQIRSFIDSLSTTDRKAG